MHYLFDFDGVLCDSFAFHHERLQRFLDIELSEERYRALHDGNFFVGGLEGDWFAYRDAIYEEQVALPMRDEVKRAVAELAKRHRLFIVSSGGERNIREYVRRNGVDVFTDILGLERHASKVEKFHHLLEKHGLEPLDCLFVTDTLGDILEAKRAGIPVVAVDYGFHERERLERGEPRAILSRFEELLELA